MPKILAIDDKRDNLVTLSALLANLMPGCTVLTAQSGPEGIGKAKTELPDVILLDIRMPDMDGFETCQRLMADATTKHIPVIMITAIKTDSRSRVKGLEIGANAFLSKPIDEVELISQLKVALRIKEAEDALRGERESLKQAVQERTADLTQEIAERKQAEEVVSQAKDDWENTFDAVTDMITVHDAEFNILRANLAARKMLGLQALEGRPFAKCFQCYHRTENMLPECPGRQSLTTGLPAAVDMFEPSLNKHVEIRAMPRFGRDGRVVGVIHIVRDITEHRKMEEQLRQSQKMEGIGQLTGGIAHDFNNILATIMGYGEMALIKMAAHDPQRSNIEHMLEATDKAAHLTKDLLLFSRRQIAVKKPVDLDMIIRNVQKILQRVIGEDIEFKVLFHVEAVPILADRNHIEQVIMNLATNARDAMPKGGTFTITLERIELDDEFVTAHGYGKPGAYALISVTDTGTGMDEEIRQRIFEPFFTTKEVGKGTGLGLSVVYGIIKQHDGYINVYSEPGMGTTFKVYLPLIEAAASLEETAGDRVYPAGDGETILLAEDDAALRALSLLVLKQFGYQVITAVNGEDAVNKFREHADSIRLLLLDLIMPKQNGKEAYDEIVKIKPGIKIIFLSGYTPEVIRQKVSIEKGATLLSKPVSAKDLLTAVREALNKE